MISIFRIPKNITKPHHLIEIIKIKQIIVKDDLLMIDFHNNCHYLVLTGLNVY
jgi:hypothetical protein